MPRIELETPDDVDAEVDHLDVTVSGPNGSVTRRLWYPDITVSVEDGAVVIESRRTTRRRCRPSVGTFESHVENMFFGVTRGLGVRDGALLLLPSRCRSTWRTARSSSRTSSASGRRDAPPSAVTPDVSVDGEERSLSGPGHRGCGPDRRRHRTAHARQRQGRPCVPGRRLHHDETE